MTSLQYQKSHYPTPVGIVRQSAELSASWRYHYIRKEKKKQPITTLWTPQTGVKDPDFTWGERAQENKNWLHHYILTENQTEDTKRFSLVSTRGAGKITILDFTWVCGHSLFGFRRRISTTERLTPKPVHVDLLNTRYQIPGMQDKSIPVREDEHWRLKK